MTTFWEKFGRIVTAYQETYWNNYWKKTNVIYPARPEWYQNISEILNMSDLPEQSIMRRYFLVHHKIAFNYSDDAKMAFAFKWCTDNLRYIGDYEKLKKYEFWQHAYETFIERTGDCEDGAILMYHIARMLGVPSWKIRLVAQDVIFKGRIVGHCFLSYLARGYMKWGYDWYALDWCYFPSRSISNFKNKTVRETVMYNPSSRPVWWAFNEDGEYAQKSWWLPFKRYKGEIEEITVL